MSRLSPATNLRIRHSFRGRLNELGEFPHEPSSSLPLCHGHLASKVEPLDGDQASPTMRIGIEPSDIGRFNQWIMKGASETERCTFKQIAIAWRECKFILYIVNWNIGFWGARFSNKQPSPPKKTIAISNENKCELLCGVPAISSQENCFFTMGWPESPREISPAVPLTVDQWNWKSIARP